MSFKELRNRAKDIDAVANEVVREEGDGGKDYLSIGIDKTGNAYCRGRFMPAPEGEKQTIVERERFSFKNADGTKEYYALSLRNLPDPDNAGKRQADPVQKYLDVLWKAGEKDLYSARKKQSASFVNFYVEEDKVNPENNGKVFKWRIPFDVKKKIDSALKPEADKYDPSKTPKPFNPFDLFGEAGGRDFIIRISDNDGKNDYSGSHFADNSSPFLDAATDNPEKAEAAYKSCHSLYQLIDPARHKSREELIDMLIDVVGPNDKYLQVAYPEECDEFKTKGKKRKSDDSAKKSEGSNPDEDHEEPKEEVKREEKAPKSSKADDLEIDF